ncbi:MAG: ribonuclease P protein component [Halofilum sp. (in: g-proteobacteria)]|nr:ribonuclease P protein component [Halofilum sp. (in: g-proteobacteria)]
MARYTRRQRLTKPSEFRRVFDSPERLGDRHVTVLARANGLPHARLGLAVGRRRMARAVARNTFKRVARESFRAHQDAIAGYDVVVLPKAAAASATRAQLRASIDRQWDILQRRAQAR